MTCPCGTTFRNEYMGRGRQRVWCEECRLDPGRQARARKQRKAQDEKALQKPQDGSGGPLSVVQLSTYADDQSNAPGAPQDRLAGECESVTRRVLSEAGRHETVPGILAITLAKEIDDPASTAPQKAALARQVEQLVKKAMDGVPPPHDFVDDLAQRRTKVISGQ